MRRFIKQLPLLAILLLALILRLHNFAQFPIAGETSDERAWTMLGASLIQTQRPSSWSYFGAYEKFGAIISNKLEPVVSPALDHPPLFALIPGMAHSMGAGWEQMPSIKRIRFPMIFLGVINVYLLYLVAVKLFKNRKLALLAGLIYASAPVFVFASRLVIAENLLITWMLLVIYVNLTKIRKKYIFLSLLSILAILTKFSGIILPTALFLYGLIQKDKKVLKSAVIGLITGVFLFFLYGAIYNLPLFLEIFFFQSSREIGLFTFHNRFFMHPAVVEKLFIDGWLILGFFASFLFMALEKNKKYFLIKILFLTNLLFILISVGQQTFHAWYDYLWHPLFAISLAYLFNFIYQKLDCLCFVLVYLLLLPVWQTLFLELDFKPSASAYRLIIACSLLPFLAVILNKKKLAGRTMKIIFILFILVNILVIFNFSQIQYWETDSFLYYR